MEKGVSFTPAYLIDENRSSEIQSMVIDVNYLIDID